MSLNDTISHYVHHCNTVMEIWYTLEMIFRVSPSIKQERINIRGKEDNNECLSNLQVLEIFLEIGSLTNILELRIESLIQLLN